LKALAEKVVVAQQDSFCSILIANPFNNKKEEKTDRAGFILHAQEECMKSSE